jgi:hypothetical protein
MGHWRAELRTNHFYAFLRKETMPQTLLFVPQDAQDLTNPDGTVTIDNGVITSITGCAEPFVDKYRKWLGLSDQDTFDTLADNWSNGYYLTFPKPE